MDCFGGEIISLAMDDNMKKELCIKAAKEAYILRKPKSGFLFHSDAGSQYTSLKYKIEHAIQSMSDVGKCYDNCRMESFFATLKKEKLYQLDTMKMTMEEVKTEVWRFVQYYNIFRLFCLLVLFCKLVWTSIAFMKQISFLHGSNYSGS